VTALTLNLIGDLEVVRDGESLPLPPSKKTRALLAYLALNPRPFRREQLCELLWELPDDPRGSLRWSLSKLRRLIDDADQARIVADRVNVRLDASDVAVDVAELDRLVDSSLASVSIETLEAAAERYRGSFLEGLELSNFHDFHAWCVAERERVMRAQASLLQTLTHRLGDAPERALPYARALVGTLPYDEPARAALIRLLVSLRYAAEAEQQYQLGVRMLKEVGAEPSGALFEAWRGAPGGKPTQVADRIEPPSPVAPPVESLIGREAEVSCLTASFERVRGLGRAAFVLLRGEPGIGKTRLLEWTAELARDNGAFVLEAGAFESEAIRPYSLWIDAYRGLGAATDVFGGDGYDNRDRLFGALSDRVASESSDRCVVVIFDDLQWCDESSAAALHYVARMNRARPLLGVLAARDDELRDNAAVQQALRGLRHDNLLEDLKLGPLQESAVCALIRERSPQADAGVLGKECGGNPLLAIELARAESAGDSGGSLDELVRERLARFDLDGADVLSWAALLSPRIDVGSLARVTGLDSNRIGEILEMAEGQAMLRPSERGFRFAHDLVARSVYAEISPARRAVMHRRVAELLEEETALDLGYAADLAHHALQSGEPGLAARAMVSAGRLCLRFFANDDALALAGQGLQLAGQLTGAERICLRLDLFDIMLSAAPVLDWETAAAEYVALAEQALDHGELAHARLGYHMASTVRWLNGHWAGAREETLQAERVTRSGTEEDHIVGLAETAKCLVMLERDLSQADAMLMEAHFASGCDVDGSPSASGTQTPELLRHPRRARYVALPRRQAGAGRRAAAGSTNVVQIRG
jgi:DNA-binding SARP family transcriptional activator